MMINASSTGTVQSKERFDAQQSIALAEDNTVQLMTGYAGAAGEIEFHESD
jgi:hypothetical protein